jgi:heme-degrading monooxygenase HmoA
MLVRKWVGTIRAKDRDEYIHYLQHAGVRDYQNTAGNADAEILLRSIGEQAYEVTVLTWWESLEAIGRFAGENVDEARYYPEDERFLLSRPRIVEHYELIEHFCPIKRAL